MKKINKTKGIIIGIYLLHLLLFTILSYFMITNINNWINNFIKLKIPTNVSCYNHIYITLYYIIFSTYSMLKALNIYINKIVGILIIIVAHLFVLLDLYIYLDFRSYTENIFITVGLIASMNAIYRKIHISSDESKSLK